MIERFQKKIQKSESGCHEWLASKTKAGYGLFRTSTTETMKKAHRVAYELYKGPIPEQLCVLHQCDNPSCVNPDHLFLGTQQENVQDRHQKKRDGNIKLSPEQVEAIRSDTRLQRVIAQEYGISRNHVSNIQCNHRRNSCHE